MALTSAKLRVFLRWLHIILGLEILCYIYSPFSQYWQFRYVTKFIVVPLIVVSGLWLWKFNQFNRFFKIRS